MCLTFPQRRQDCSTDNCRPLGPHSPRRAAHVRPILTRRSRLARQFRCPDATCPLLHRGRSYPATHSVLCSDTAAETTNSTEKNNVKQAFKMRRKWMSFCNCFCALPCRDRRRHTRPWLATRSARRSFLPRCVCRYYGCRRGSPARPGRAAAW